MRWHAAFLTGLALSPLCVAAEVPDNGGAADRAYRSLGRSDCTGALKELNAGILAGEAKAFLVLGTMYRKGTCVAQDGPRAVEQFERAAEAGNSSAAEQLVLVYGLGAGVPQDYARAGRWMLRSVGEKGNEGMPPSSIGTPEVASVNAFGQVATIQALAAERIGTLILRSPYPYEVSIVVTVASAKPNALPTVTVDDPAVAPGSELVMPGRMTRDVRDYVERVFDQVVRELPVLVPDSAEVVEASRQFVLAVRRMN